MRLFGLIFSLLVLGCCSSLTPLQVAEADASGATRISLVLVSDVYQGNEQNGRGGMARIGAVLKAEKARGAHVLTFHGGDTLSPSLMSGLDQGASIVELFNMTPLDYFVPGNHEFDFGPENFLKRMGELKARVLAANLRSSEGKAIAGIGDSDLINAGDVKIGIIGLTDENSPVSSKPGKLKFSGALAHAQSHAKQLRAQGADLIVLLVHAGRALDEELFSSSTADVVLSGHDHDLYLRYNEKTVLVEGGEDGLTIPVVDLDVAVSISANGTRKVRIHPRFRFIDTADVAPDTAIATRVKVHEARLDQSLGQPIGVTETELDSRNATVRGGEAAIGNLFADAVRTEAKADIAILNGGGFRGGKLYPAGTTLTRKDVLTELPFLNKTFVLSLSGQDLWNALEQGFDGAENENGRFPQVSGLTIRADVTRPVGRRVVSVLVNGRTLEKRRTYLLATNDYLARGGDGYLALTKGKVTMGDAEGLLVSNMVIDYIRAKGRVAPKFEGRIIVARAKAPQ